MMNNEDNPKFWENIYKNDDAGWDLGAPTPVFVKISSIIKPKKICIIGCGRGYDAVMFAKNNFDEGLGAVKTLLHKPIFHLANPDFFLNTYGYIKIERGETKEGLFLAIKCIYFSKFSIKNNLYSSDIDFQNLIVNALDTFAFGLTNLKEYSDALVLYNKVIDLAPNHSEIAEHFTNRGKCKVRLGDFKGARIDFKKGNYI